MSRALQKYLDQVMIYANRNEADTTQIRAEQEDHLLKKTAELEAEGQSREDAVFGAIENHGHPRTVGYGLRKHQWIDIRTQGTARGFIAIGPKAVGTIAMGGAAFGFFACGIVGVGVVSFSLISIALLFSYGAAFAFAPFGLAHGSIAVGLMAAGFWSCGITAIGYESIGLYVPSWYPPGSHSSYFGGQAPFPLVYLHTLMKQYIYMWSKWHSLTACFVFHSVIFSCLVSAGVTVFYFSIRQQQRQIGYIVPSIW
jgi:hypothetical protein